MKQNLLLEYGEKFAFAIANFSLKNCDSNTFLKQKFLLRVFANIIEEESL